MIVEISILVLAGVVMSLTQVFKKIWGDKISKYIPILAIAIGLFFSFLFQFNENLLQIILVGLIVGLTSTGFYENTLDKINIHKVKG